ncbi:transcription termination factor MTEF1, chloroplastic-like [Miscanthus floridulus]|uniref:transcription termination factor MTEF1, chloroplastic-like n=1 Tax=Miscanthus floridulus TaxID=154761 RepID=UPI0034580222
MLCLRNRLFPLLRATSLLPSPVHCPACGLFSTSTSTAILPAPFSLEDYLIASCGLAPAQAFDVSKKAFCNLSRESSKEISRSRLLSAANPDAIIALLAGAGLSRADIVAAVSADPLLLRASVKNIAPRLVALRDRVGLSTPQIAGFLLVGSLALRKGDVVPKLEFFISFYGSFEQVLVAAKKCKGLLTASLERVIKPNIALFRQWGVGEIARLCLEKPWVLTFNRERVKEVLLLAEELGVPTTSRMFRHAVAAVADISKEKVAAKLEFFKRTLCCSESEVLIAVSKMPKILGLSDENIGRKIEFLINEAAMEPQYIVERPVLLSYSLEKRLVPRHYVLKVLQEKGLLNSNMNFYTLSVIGEETFKSKFIDCHKDSVPGLAHAFAADRAGIVPSRV